MTVNDELCRRGSHQWEVDVELFVLVEDANLLGSMDRTRQLPSQYCIGCGLLRLRPDPKRSGCSDRFYPF